MKTSEYIAKRIKKETSIVFGITGGAIVNLFDSMDKKGLKVINMHHEQACAMAADAYARVSGKLGVVIATSGPGATNLITGTCCSWYDSIPVLTIAGQVPTSQLRKKDAYVRQLGFQETNTVALFESITKFSKRVDDVSTDLNKAIQIAKQDRKGPTFLELCDDTQREEMKHSPSFVDEIDRNPSTDYIKRILELVWKAQRPILIIGSGGKYAKKLLDKFKIPTFLTWGAMDLLPHDHPLNCRDFGVTSQRIGNFAIKNADLIISIGSRLDTHQVVGNWAPNAVKIIVDVDSEEVKKFNYHYKFDCGTKKFVDTMIKENKITHTYSKWLNRIQKLRKKYPLPKTAPYEFINKLSKYAKEGDIIITDAGQTLVWTMQAWKVKKGQRLFSAFNHSPMGYAIPASIGAHFASPDKNIICITGDGGLQMNLQELQTIRGYKLPIKIFVLDNNGYGMIKQTQDDWKELKNKVSCEPYMADLECVSYANDIDYREINKKNIDIIEEILEIPHPIITKVHIPNGTKIEPKLKYGDEFDDLTPKLSKKERREINNVLHSS